ncbi:MAG: DUF485 domain-containing protein [Erythrobacter sp.]
MQNQKSPKSLASAVEEISRIRARMVLVLSAILLSGLAVGLYLMAQGADIAARPIAENSSINMGILFASIMVFGGAAITAFYSIWANRKLDHLIQEARDLRAKPE